MVKARTDEHELKINMVVRNQDYLKNAASQGMFGGGGGGGHAVGGNTEAMSL